MAALPAEKLLKPDLMSFATLVPYATTFRYPAPSGRIRPAPDSAMIERHLGMLAALIDECLQGFGVDPESGRAHACAGVRAGGSAGAACVAAS